MVMADIGDRDRGRRRRRRGGRRDREDFEYMQSVPPVGKPPIILAKPHGYRYPSNSHVEYSNGPVPRSEPVDICSRGSSVEPTMPVLLKSRDHSEDAGIRRQPQTSSKPSAAQSSAVAGVVTIESGSPQVQQVYTIQRPTPVASHGRMEGGATSRLPPPPDMTHSMKLVDESLMWCEGGMEMLLDQTDFLVVGVLGMQGSGKSTVLSHLAGNELGDSVRNFVFRPQSKDVRESGAHQSCGVDMYVTGDRTILLDSQALLSSSLLDHVINHDKKYSTEYSTPENCMEVQSMQMTSFMFTVCNVVLVVLDWFVDINLLKFLQTAEMLKPPTPSASHDSQEDHNEYFPHVVFVLNRAGREDFSVESFGAMQRILTQIMSQSQLKLRGGPSLVGTKLLPALNLRTVPDPLNLTLLPDMDDNSQGNKDGVLGLLEGYRGRPSYDSLLTSLRSQTLAVPRRLMAHTTLSEKNWFHYAARTWDSVRKSQLFSEYNRLLP